MQNVTEAQRSLSSYQFLLLADDAGDSVGVQTASMLAPSGEPVKNIETYEESLFAGEIRRYKLTFAGGFKLSPEDEHPRLRDVRFQVLWVGRPKPMLDVRLAGFFPPDTWDLPSKFSSEFIIAVYGTGQRGFSGDGGPATSAQLWSVTQLALDDSGNLFITDRGNHNIRRVDATTGIITTVAGTGERGFSGDGGPATSAQLHDPTGLAIDGAGNLYIVDSDNYRIRRVDATTGIITTVAGTGERGAIGDGGPAINAQFINPWHVAVDSAGILFVSDLRGSAFSFRRVDASTGIIDRTSLNVGIRTQLEGGAVDKRGNIFYLSDYYQILRVDAQTQATTPVSPWPKYDVNMAADDSGNLFISSGSQVFKVRVPAPAGPQEAPAPAPTLAPAARLEMKLPLRGGKSWLLTVEAGGRVTSLLGGGVDEFHTDARNGFYALDFDDLTREDGPLTNVL
ncbi:MAG: hypothetical protein IH956_06600, partial [Chloroflexi bacterium]|nr:hypothetical protein [Chloroflexota bacterium]